MMLHSTLTHREMDVFGLLTQGLKNKEIAVALVITEGTVEGHVHSIFRKLDVHTRAQATFYAMRNHLFDEKIMDSLVAPARVSKV